MKKLSNENISEIINLYQSGITPKEIGEKFQIYNNSVTRILKKHGVERNQLEKVSQETCDLIIKEYTNGISSTIIANKLNINDSTVCRILKRNNIKIRPPEINKRTFNINQDYFENIDSEDKANFFKLLRSFAIKKIATISSESDSEDAETKSK
jgi:DNA-binding transcriptional regulator LsrR (DeoR family)